MQYITLTDFLLFPLYLFFFYVIIKILAKKYNGTPLKKYFILAFFLHMGGSFLYAMLIQFYYGYGDSFGFYMGSNFIRNFISDGGNPLKIIFLSSEELLKPQNLALFSVTDMPASIGSNANFMIMKISALLSYFSFNSYLIISLFFGLFSFAGLWKLFGTFNQILDKKAEKLLAFTILYTPSICFWGSGLIKDTICLGLVGFIIYFIYKILILKKIMIRDIALLAIMFYLLYILKNYIASILILSISLSYIIFIITKSRGNIIKLAVVSMIIIISSVVLFLNLASSIESLVEESKEQIEIFKGAYSFAETEDNTSLAGFKGADYELSVSSFILRSPITMFSTLFRPYFWESQKLIMLFSALESFLMLLALMFVLYKCAVFRFFTILIADPYIFFAFIFTFLLAAVVGFTTFNFGTLVRYRLPILPFYFFMLIAVYTKNKITLLTVNKF